ncbi:MAG TPA: TatD family deoxyribonuclease [Acidiferrobacteraceae bacterium]|nr:TatD family deoxyribonuclease [Acidiferrobacteraceae bacterium]
MQFVDSHCHINFEPLSERVGELLALAQENSVDYFLCVSVNLEDYPQVLALARSHDNIFASVGVHPNEREGQDPTVEELVALATDPLVVAIGETGLDYFRSEGDLDWQRQRFTRHIEAARCVAKPLIIHSRDAAADTLKIMVQERASEVTGVMHCFAEDWEVAKAALDLGFYISFSGIVTFKSAGILREVARKVPADRMLIETDAPYLAPVPHRGKINEPAYVYHVAECLAEVRNTCVEEIGEQTTDNFFNLFPLAIPLKAQTC